MRLHQPVRRLADGLGTLPRSRFVLLGVPSNDFGGQEPGSETQIKSFCAVNFNVDFPLTAKHHVKGDDAHPFYRWAGDRLGFIAKPRWNFHKYLVAPGRSPGRLVLVDHIAFIGAGDKGHRGGAAGRQITVRIAAFPSARCAGAHDPNVRRLRRC